MCVNVILYMFFVTLGLLYIKQAVVITSSALRLPLSKCCDCWSVAGCDRLPLLLLLLDVVEKSCCRVVRSCSVTSDLPLLMVAQTLSTVPPDTLDGVIFVHCRRRVVVPRTLHWVDVMDTGGGGGGGGGGAGGGATVHGGSMTTMAGLVSVADVSDSYPSEVVSSTLSDDVTGSRLSSSPT